MITEDIKGLVERLKSISGATEALSGIQRLDILEAADLLDRISEGMETAELGKFIRAWLNAEVGSATADDIGEQDLAQAVQAHILKVKDHD